MFCVGVRKNELRYASAHTHIVESPRSAHQVGHQTQPDPRSPPTCQMTHVIYCILLNELNGKYMIRYIE